jgi:hypothetical protein
MSIGFFIDLIEVLTDGNVRVRMIGRSTGRK